MEKSYRFRLYPTAAQERRIRSAFDACRFVYNRYLAKRTEAYRDGGGNLDYYACSADLTKLKRELPWLRAADCTTLQSALRDLDNAFRTFFRQSGYPNFKRKRDPRKSFTSRRVPGKENVAVGEDFVKLPKLGEIRCRVSKRIEGRIVSATVSQSPGGKYFVSVCCTDVETRTLPATERSVTAEDFAFSPDAKKIARLTRGLSRKSKDGKNREKARLKLARAYERDANRRRDAAQKLTTRLVRENDVIRAGESQNRELLRYLDYKCRWYGRELIRGDARLSA
ncbi:MAG: transposase [Oscillospiraceae bacterium]|jgi:putative transposase|nr:transposase [Oscillospiraceae bacterium]